MTRITRYASKTVPMIVNETDSHFVYLHETSALLGAELTEEG